MADNEKLVATLISETDDALLMTLCTHYPDNTTRIGRISWLIHDYIRLREDAAAKSEGSDDDGK